jgi:hypothetical protein
MTAKWGPLGWMTLHSISVAYPHNPTDEDKRIVNDFVNSFAATITCMHCRSDFSETLNGYKKNVPSWANSKRDLFLAVCRMHNTVNKKLDKPTPKTVAECIQSLQNATSYTSQHDFRKNYIEYLFRDWNIYGRGTHYLTIALQNARNMQKINEEYWNAREVAYSSLKFEEANVLTYENQPVQNKFIIPRMDIRKIRWKPIAR